MQINLKITSLFLILFFISHCHSLERSYTPEEIEQLHKKYEQAIDNFIKELTVAGDFQGDIKTEDAFYICSFIMVSRYFGSLLIFGEDQVFYAIDPKSLLEHEKDEVNIHYMYKIRIYDEPLEYMNIITKKEHHANEKCIIGDKVWVMIGKPEPIPPKNHPLSLLVDILTFASFSFPGKFQNVRTVTSHPGIYSVNTLNGTLIGAIKHYSEVTTEEFQQIISDYQRWSTMKMTTINSNNFVLSPNNLPITLDENVISFSSIPITAEDNIFSSSEYIDAYRYIGKIIGELHLKSQSLITKIPESILNNDITDFVQLINKKNQKREMDIRAIQEILFVFEKIIMEDENFRSYLSLTVPLDSIHMTFENISPYNIKKVATPPTLFDVESEIAPSIKEYYRQLSKAFVTAPSIDEFIFAMSAMNSSMYEYSNTRYPESLQIFYRLYTALYLAAHMESINPIMIFPEFFPDYSSIPLSKIEIDAIRKSESKQQIEQMYKVLEPLSIWRFIKTDRDLYYLFTILSNVEDENL